LKLRALVLLILGAWAVPALAQTGTLRGQVTDPSGAVVTGARVTVAGADGQTRSARTDSKGGYEIGDLAPGTYTVSTSAKGFAAFAKGDVEVAAGRTQQVDIQLEISVEKEKVNVEDESSQVQVSPQNNASVLVLKGSDLDALPDDPDELQQDLQALAGPSAGPNGGQIYIDGFTGGQLPPKESIREIRVNQNPFSAEYDKLGYGRIEIFTKPGTDKFHGMLSVMGNDSAFNARNPFLAPEQAAPYFSTLYMANLGGPLSKKASFFLDFHMRDINEVAVVNTPALSPDLSQQITLSESVANPQTHYNFGSRIDYQLSRNNTLTARYQWVRNTQDNAGVGQFALPSTGHDTSSTEHTLQISDTQVLGTKAVNETRFQYNRDNSQQTPLNTGPTITVIGAFTGGGSNGGLQTDHTDRYELQNYTSVAMGKHFLKFGGRLRVEHEVSFSGAGFNGTFVFPDLSTYQTAAQAIAGGANAAPGAIQFSLNASPAGGVPTIPVTVADAGLYVQDEWRVRSNVTLSYGLRFETQNAIHDHADWAPRVAVAWGVGGGKKSPPKTVLRAGWGIFYDRFDEGLVLNTDRFNGTTQQKYIVAATDGNPIDFFPNVPPVSELPVSQTTPTIYQIGPSLRAPYTMQGAVSLERQVTKVATVSVSYLNSRGVHQFLSVNANAPLPGTPYSDGPRPLGDAAGNVYRYISEGIFKQNQLITNFNVRAGAKLMLFGFYSLNYANSDAAGAGSFPSNQYDISADYGRAAFAVRHRFLVGGSIGMPYGFRLSPFMIVNSGMPYNVMVGQDLSDDSLLNDRPAFAADPTGACVSPTAACHYTVPTTAYTPIPVNYLTGPDHFTLNLRLAKTFGFGPERNTNPTQPGEGPGGPGGGHGPGGFGGGPRGGGGRGPGGHGGPFAFGGTSSRRYSLTFSVNARNILNRVNLGTPNGNLSSPLFGKSNSLAGGPFSSPASNRRIELQASFNF
jgi:hypothetical protein